jgi:hypothetical protein
MARRFRFTSFSVILAALLFGATASGQQVRFDSVTPTIVHATGGDHIRINGQYFETPFCFFPGCPQPRVTIDGVNAQILVFSDTVLEVVTPPHLPGTASIVFYPQFQTAATFPNAITYVTDIPTLSGSVLALLAVTILLIGALASRK